MTIAIARERPLPMEASNGRVPMRAPAVGISRTSMIRRIAGVLEDAGLLLLGVLLLPLVILLIGAPVAFCIRVLLELAHRL
jgi:hypothetical protein